MGDVQAPPAPARSVRQRLVPVAPRAEVWQRLWLATLVVAGLFCFITFAAKGGLNLESMTTTEMVLTLASGALVAASVLLAPAGRRAYGLWPLGLLLAFAMLSAISVVWSVAPDESWQDANRLLAYSAVFAAGIALVRVAPGRWPAILGGVTLAAVVVSAYALATKVWPASLAPSDAYARLNEPYGYWNAVGLTAALGAIGCLWLGARRSGHALLRALAYPAMGLLLLALVLAYSRGALAALAVGLALWFWMVPLRLRGAALLIAGAAGAGAVAAWDFSRHALSSEGVALAQRTPAGHQLGALVVAMLALLTAVGIAVGFLTGRRAPSPLVRRRAGVGLLAAIVLAVVAFAGALAHSHRGLGGSVSHAVSALTNPNAKPPPNTPGRLTAVASVRARYWKEGLQVFAAHPALGVGAEGYATAHQRYETETLEVRHAHSFIVQTLADLGIVGLLTALALLLTWMAAAGRATHPFNRRWTSWRAWLEIRSGARPGWSALPAGELTRYPPERIAMLSMLTLVVVFGAHALIDWTWYVPGNACVALLCAGWLAGRGPLVSDAGEPAGTVRQVGPRSGFAVHDGARRTRGTGDTRPSYARIAVASAAILAALLAAWSQWQPQRSEEASQEADARLEAGDTRGAIADADSAIARDPLSVEALFTLAGAQRVSGQPARARSTLERAVRLEPSNPQTWLALARYDLASDPRAAVAELQAAIYLDPQSISAEAIAAGNRKAIEVHNDYLEALRAMAAPVKPVPRVRARSTTGAATGLGGGLKNARGSPGRAAVVVRPAVRPQSPARSP